MSAAYESRLFPENAAGVTTASNGDPLSVHPPVFCGGQLAVNVQQREESEENAQEKGVEIALHLAF